MQKNILFLLSELEPAHFNHLRASEIASGFKKAGATRIDLTNDPRVSLPDTHRALAKPVNDFDKAARDLARTIFGPVIGGSSVRDLTHTTTKQKRLPDIKSLSNVGTLFARKACGTLGLGMNERDGAALGLILFLALHGTTEQGKAYEKLVYANLSGTAQDALKSLDAKLISENIDGYSALIDLARLRHRMNDLRPQSTLTARLS